MNSLTQMVHQITQFQTLLLKQIFKNMCLLTGVNDDGVGEPLDDFIQFQIKIVMQGTDNY